MVLIVRIGIIGRFHMKPKRHKNGYSFKKAAVNYCNLSMKQNTDYNLLFKYFVSQEAYIVWPDFSDKTT